MSVQALRIMQFNIEYGGDGVDFSSVTKAINAAEADVVAIQEGCGKMAQIAADLGWAYYDARSQVVSRYPLLNPTSAMGGAIFVEVSPRSVVAIINVHPPSRGYGPTRLVNGASVAQVLRRERKLRVSALEPSVAAARLLMAQQIPVILLGDFNAPSHRDWTKEAVGLREHVTKSVEWPTSVVVEAAGLVDVYREIFPDPVTHQGLTWPALRPFVKGYNPARAGKAADRIDLMYAGGAAHATCISLVGEVGSEFTDIPVEPWPTDHRAIVATFEVEPGRTPTLVSTARRLVEVGQEVQIRYNATDDNAAEIALVPSGGGILEATLRSPLASGDSGSWSLDTRDPVAAAHDILLLSDSGDELARTCVWLVLPGTSPVVATGSFVYLVGENIDVRWEFAPGNRADYVAIYERGADPRVARRLLWAYTDATVVGSAVFH